MLNKLARKLLKQVAEKLGRYAKSLEEYLAEENLPERDLFSINSDDGPPAHWLAKIRQEAPHLLDQTTSQNDPATFHFETDDQNSQLLSSHHHQPIDRSGEQEMLLKPPLSSTQSPRFSNQSGQESSGRVKSKNLIEPVIKFIDRLLPIAAVSSKRSEMDSEELPQTTYTGQNDSSSNENAILKNKTPPSRKMDLNAIRQKKSSSQFQQIDTAHSSQSKPKFHSTSEAYHIPDANKSEVNKKAPQQPEYSSKKTPRENQHTIHIYPVPRIKIEAIHSKRNYRAKNSRNELNAQASSIKERIHKIPGTDPLRTIEPKKNETSNFHLSDKPQKNTCNQHHVENKQISATSEPVFFNTAQKAIEQKQKTFESYNTNHFKPDFSQWPDLPGKVKSDTKQDTWPQLPQEEWFKPEETDHQRYKFWQLQEAMKRKSLSEQEQKGKLWNG